MARVPVGWLAAGLVALLTPPADARDLADSLRGTWRVETASMFPGGVLPVDKTAPKHVQEDQLEEALEDVPEVRVEFAAETMTLVVGDERHPASFRTTRVDRSGVSFESVERGGPPRAMRAEFVGPDEVTLTQAGDAQVLRLKRERPAAR